MTGWALVGFALAVLPLVVTPGASFTLVTAHRVEGRSGAAHLAIAGTALGILTHGIVAGLGLSAVALASAQVYHAIRLLGAAYLVGLGVVMVVRAVRRPEDQHPRSDGRPPARHPLLGAYVANVLNPKAAAVYLTLAPQFVPGGFVGVAPFVALAAVHCVVMAVWLTAWGTGLPVVLGRVSLASLRRWADGLGGGVLIALGIRDAVRG